MPKSSKLKRIALSAVLGSIPIFAHAQDFTLNTGGFGVEAGLSTFGWTVSPSYQLNDYFGVRAPIGYLQTTDDEDSNATTKWALSGAAVLVDVYPLQSTGFRLSAGLALPLYKYTAEIEDSSLEIGGTRYDVDSAKYVINTTGTAPMIGVGYQFGSRESGWTGAIDLGVLFEVGYEADFDYSAPDLTDEQRAEIDQGIKDDGYLDGDANDFFDPVKQLPFLSIAATYRF